MAGPVNLKYTYAGDTAGPQCELVTGDYLARCTKTQNSFSVDDLLSLARTVLPASAMGGLRSMVGTSLESFVSQGDRVIDTESERTQFHKLVLNTRKQIYLKLIQEFKSKPEKDLTEADYQCLGDYNVSRVGPEDLEFLRRPKIARQLAQLESSSIPLLFLLSEISAGLFEDVVLLILRDKTLPDTVRKNPVLLVRSSESRFTKLNDYLYGGKIPNPLVSEAIKEHIQNDDGTCLFLIKVAFQRGHTEVIQQVISWLFQTQTIEAKSFLLLLRRVSDDHGVFSGLLSFSMDLQKFTRSAHPDRMHDPNLVKIRDNFHLQLAGRMRDDSADTGFILSLFLIPLLRTNSASNKGRAISWLTDLEKLWKQNCEQRQIEFKPSTYLNLFEFLRQGHEHLQRADFNNILNFIHADLGKREEFILGCKRVLHTKWLPSPVDYHVYSNASVVLDYLMSEAIQKESAGFQNRVSQFFDNEFDGIELLASKDVKANNIVFNIVRYMVRTKEHQSVASYQGYTQGFQRLMGVLQKASKVPDMKVAILLAEGAKQLVSARIFPELCLKMLADMVLAKNVASENAYYGLLIITRSLIFADDVKAVHLAETKKLASYALKCMRSIAESRNSSYNLEAVQYLLESASPVTRSYVRPTISNQEDITAQFQPLIDELLRADAWISISKLFDSESQESLNPAGTQPAVERVLTQGERKNYQKETRVVVDRILKTLDINGLVASISKDNEWGVLSVLHSLLYYGNQAAFQYLLGRFTMRSPRIFVIFEQVLADPNLAHLHADILRVAANLAEQPIDQPNQHAQLLLNYQASDGQASTAQHSYDTALAGYVDRLGSLPPPWIDGFAIKLEDNGCSKTMMALKRLADYLEPPELTPQTENAAPAPAPKPKPGTSSASKPQANSLPGITEQKRAAELIKYKLNTQKMLTIDATMRQLAGANPLMLIAYLYNEVIKLDNDDPVVRHALEKLIILQKSPDVFIARDAEFALAELVGECQVMVNTYPIPEHQEDYYARCYFILDSLVSLEYSTDGQTQE